MCDALAVLQHRNHILAQSAMAICKAKENNLNSVELVYSNYLDAKNVHHFWKDHHRIEYQRIAEDRHLVTIYWESNTTICSP